MNKELLIKEKLQDLFTSLDKIPTEVIMPYIMNREDVFIVQYYYPKHIKDISGIGCSVESIIEHSDEIKEYLRCEWMMEKCNEHLSEMSDYADEWGLEELFSSENWAE
jgi:hypothetical protein